MRLFHPEAPLMQALTYLANLVILNLVYVLCCIPIVTIGAAKPALFYACNRLRAGKGGNVRAFFQAFRANLWPGIGVWLLLVVVLVLLVLDLVLVAQSTAYLVLCLLGIDLWLLFDAAVFPLCARFACGFGQLMKSGLYVGLSQLPRTAPLAVLHALPVVLLLFAPGIFWRITPLFLVLYDAAVATLAGVLLEKPFERYMEPGER